MKFKATNILDSAVVTCLAILATNSLGLGVFVSFVWLVASTLVEIYVDGPGTDHRNCNTCGGTGVVWTKVGKGPSDCPECHPVSIDGIRL